MNISLQKFIYKAITEEFPKIELSPEEIILEAPGIKEHGDTSTNIAMKLAKFLKMPPMNIAQSIVSQMQKDIAASSLNGKFAKIVVKEPGFINFFFTNIALYDCLTKIQSEGARYASSDLGKGRRVQIEFVSANPTGPLTVAHGRQAVVGDSLANILEFTGWRVTREYFINDEGRQMNILGESIRLRYLELLGEKIEFPEDGYKGKYIYDIAQGVINKYGKKFIELSEKTKQFFREYGCKSIMDDIKKDLEDFNVFFDVWTSQAKLAKAERIKDVFKNLEKQGFLYKQDGALWFKSTAFGDDKDRVVIKSDGSFTYLAPDIVYHKDKFQRGFDKVINILGPDHHGYIPRLTAAVMALGYPKEAIKVLIVQLATIYKGGEQVRMSTRAGEFVTLREVMDDAGKDAARFFFVARRISSHLDFDIELAKKQSQENPVYYIQYAYARISNIIEFAKEKEKGDGSLFSDEKKFKKENRPLFPIKAKLDLLVEQEELDLIRALGKFASVVASCSEFLEPCGVVSYLQSLANSFHSFYDKHRVVTDNLELTRARLVLVDCVKIVLSNALKLLGISTPEKM